MHRVFDFCVRTETFLRCHIYPYIILNSSKAYHFHAEHPVHFFPDLSRAVKPMLTLALERKVHRGPSPPASRSSSCPSADKSFDPPPVPPYLPLLSPSVFQRLRRAIPAVLYQHCAEYYLVLKTFFSGSFCLPQGVNTQLREFPHSHSEKCSSKPSSR